MTCNFYGPTGPGGILSVGHLFLWEGAVRGAAEICKEDISERLLLHECLERLRRI